MAGYHFWVSTNLFQILLLYLNTPLHLFSLSACLSFLHDLSHYPYLYPITCVLSLLMTFFPIIIMFLLSISPFLYFNYLISDFQWFIHSPISAVSSPVLGFSCPLSCTCILQFCSRPINICCFMFDAWLRVLVYDLQMCISQIYSLMFVNQKTWPSSNQGSPDSYRQNQKGDRITIPIHISFKEHICQEVSGTVCSVYHRANNFLPPYFLLL